MQSASPINGNFDGPLVVKLGGSLFDLPDFHRRIELLLQSVTGEIWIIAGGGGFADEIRRLDQIHQWPVALSHRLALQSMSLSAKVVSHARPGWELVNGVPEQSTESHRRIRVLDVTTVPGIESLPATWDLTSDSIAAWVARSWGAGRLLLLKSVDLPCPVPSWSAAAEAGLVDTLFPRYAASLRELGWCNVRSALPEISACKIGERDQFSVTVPNVRNERD